MLNSMTGFARASQITENYQMVWECRSVNHRYLEISLRLPDFLSEIETLCREKIQAHITRGKVYAELSLIPISAQKKKFEVDQGLVLGLLDAAEQIQSLAQVDTPLRLKDLIKWPGVIKEQDLDQQSLADSVLSLLGQAVKELAHSREREGQKLQAVLAERLNQIEKASEEIIQSLPAVQEQLREKLRTKLAEVQIGVDENRFEQEVIFYLNKMDIQEELDRLKAHISETRNTFQQAGGSGRRLDFLMQEFNREVNTIASKSVGIAVTQTAVSMKVWIEQMREQVQNIE